MAVHKTVPTDYVHIDCAAVEAFCQDLDGKGANAAHIQATVNGLLGQIDAVMDGRASAAVAEYRASVTNEAIRSVSDGSRLDRLHQFLEAALRDICDMVYGNEGPVPYQQAGNGMPYIDDGGLIDDLFEEFPFLQQIEPFVSMTEEELRQMAAQFRQASPEHAQLLLLQFAAQRVVDPDQRAALLHEIQNADGPRQLTQRILNEQQLINEIGQGIRANGIQGPMVIPLPFPPRPPFVRPNEGRPIDNGNGQGNDNDPDNGQGNDNDPDNGQGNGNDPDNGQGNGNDPDNGQGDGNDNNNGQGNGNDPQNDNTQGQDSGLPTEETVPDGDGLGETENGETETGWEGSYLEDGSYVPDPTDNNVGPSFDPAFEDGPSYVSQNNSELYDTYAESRTEMETLQARTDEAIGRREELITEIRELDTQISSGGSSSEIINRSDALREELRTLDTALYEDQLRLEELELEVGEYEERLGRIWPNPEEANLEKIRELEGGRTSYAVLQATYTSDRSVGCVHYVCNRMPIPAGIARNAHMWDNQAVNYAEYGIQVGNVPLEGSVLVMEREHSYGHDVYGHVMYVERVEHGVVWVTDNMNSEPVRLTDLTQETSGPFIKYLYMPWHTKA